MPVITTKPFKELASYSRFLNLLQFHAGVTVFLSSGHLGGFFSISPFFSPYGVRALKEKRFKGEVTRLRVCFFFTSAEP